MATHGEIRRPPAGTSDGRLRGVSDGRRQAGQRRTPRPGPRGRRSRPFSDAVSRETAAFAPKHAGSATGAAASENGAACAQATLSRESAAFTPNQAGGGTPRRGIRQWRNSTSTDAVSRETAARGPERAKGGTRAAAPEDGAADARTDALHVKRKPGSRSGPRAGTRAGAPEDGAADARTDAFTSTAASDGAVSRETAAPEPAGANAAEPEPGSPRGPTPPTPQRTRFT
jgi:hypothetical protein